MTGNSSPSLEGPIPILVVAPVTERTGALGHVDEPAGDASALAGGNTGAGQLAPPFGGMPQRGSLGSMPTCEALADAGTVATACRGRAVNIAPSPLHAQTERRPRVTIVPGKTAASEQCV